MGKNSIRINISVLIFIIIFICSFSMVYFINKNTNRLFKNKDKVYSVTFESVNNKKGNLKYKFPRPGNTNNFISIAYIKKENIKKIGNNAKKIVIYRLTGNSYKIYFNNFLIGTMGDVKEQHSDIWNNLGVYTIPDNIIKDINQIKIESYNEYEFGLLGYPVSITSTRQAIRIQNWIYMIHFGVNLIVMGTLIINFIILLILSMFVDHQLKKMDYSYMFFAFSILLIALTIFDHIQINVIYISLLSYKKIITAGYYIAPIFVSSAIGFKFKSKILKVVSFILFLCLIYLVLIPKNIISLKKAYDITNYFLIVTMVIWFLVILKNFKNSIHAKILFIGSFFQLLFAGYDLINFALGNTFNNFYTYGIFTFSLSIIGVVLLDIIKLMGNLEFEKKRSKILYERSIHDGMTNVYNHQYIHSVLKETNENYSLIIVDIDDFKNINDQFGHLTGDVVIKRIANICKKNIKENGIVGRYGGDEFIIILFSNNHSIENISKKIKKEIETPFIFENNEIKTSVSMGIFNSKKGVHYEKILKMADHGLYEAKKQGKSRIIKYQNHNVEEI